MVSVGSFIDTTMKDFVLMNVDRVGRVNVHLEEQPLEILLK